MVMTSALHAEGREFNPRSEQSFFFASTKKNNTRGGIRTRGLLLRRETRYPLRYTDVSGNRTRQQS